jgi:rSAM/selenodomain-associated transferase 2
VNATFDRPLSLAPQAVAPPRLASPARLELAVVVPILNEARQLPALLRRLSLFGSGAEIIVVDGGSSDNSVEVAESFAAVQVVHAPRGRAIQMNAGARAARSEVLFFLHGDTLPPADAQQRILVSLADPAVLAGSFCLSFDRQSPLLNFYAWCSTANTLLTTFGDQGLFLRRATFEQLGGFAVMPFLEDIEIQRRLRRRGRFVKLPAALRTSARRFTRHGVLRQQLVNIGLVGAYLAGCRVESLKKLYSDER